MHLDIAQTKRQTVLSLLITSVFLVFSLTIFSEDKQNSTDLLNQYITSKGYHNTIIFDSSNIKQYWIDNSVSSKDNSIIILLLSFSTNGKESVPLKIQLANVNETLDCKIEVIAENKDFSFTVLDSNSKELSSSENEDDFVNYSIASSIFHLEDAQNRSFNLRFASKSADVLSIKKIILSFSNNKTTSFLVSPGELKITGNTINTNSRKTNGSDNSFSVTGNRSTIFSSPKIYVTDNTLSSSITIKNTGENATSIYVGYTVYGKDHTQLRGNHYPFQKNKTINVIAAEAGSNTIIVDSYSNWGKGCFVALNAKEDLSDIPNSTFLEGHVVEIKKLENDQAEIVLDKPLLTELKPGTKIRIHGSSGAYLYTGARRIEPGEEATFTSTIKKDNSLLEYSTKAFPRGAYYVIPLILSYSVDSKVENTILIQDFTVNY